MYKLLLADDERIIREGISNSINWDELGISITTASNGLEAYEMILKDPPHIVITDIKMPGLNGIELIEKVRESLPNIIFIILSAYAEFSFAAKAMEYGVKYYLLKPTDEEDIIKTLNKVMVELKYIMMEGAINFDYDKISQLVKNGNVLEITKEIDVFFTVLKNNKLELKVCKTYCSELLMNIVRQSKPDKAVEYLKRSCELEKLMTLEDIYKFVLKTAIEIAKNNEQEHKNSQSPIVQSIIKYVRDNISNEELSLSWIASNCIYMNSDYLGKVFKKEMNENFPQYLTRIRIDKAKNMILSDKEYTISNIAEEVGFGSNPQYFSQVFKKYTGYTPKDYKKIFGS